MKRFYYDLHIHSCLSPCADDDMTPANICAMASLKGLKMIALTDHNSCGNCESFYSFAEKYELIPIAGAEVTTSEDIHVICLFEKLENALCFSSELYKFRTPFQNSEKIFGKQIYTNFDDEEKGRESDYLPIATKLGLDDAYSLVKKHGGIMYPAHIDRHSNGIISILGTIPEKPIFTCAEYNRCENREKYESEYPILQGMKHIVNSDAHNLWSINECENFIELDVDGKNSDEVRQKLFEYLKKHIRQGERKT